MSTDAMLGKVETGGTPVSPELPPMFSASDLQRKEFPPVSWLLPDMIPEGLTLLAGKPKLGKSWLALQLGYGVATGSAVLGRPVEPGGVLYAALEDNPRRLKSRLKQSAPPSAEWPENLKFVVNWPRLDAGGLDKFETWASLTPEAKLIIVDTLATVRPSGNAKESLYQGDYGALRGLHQLASNTGLSIIAVHHVRKAEAEDPFDTVSGSTGLTGAADTTLLLMRAKGGVMLCGRGRDLPEFESALGFDAASCLWSDLGRPSDVFGSETRQAIKSALKAGKQTPKEIADHTGLDYDLCAKTLQRMTESGEITKGGRGCYRLPPDPLSM